MLSYRRETTLQGAL